MAIGQDDRNCPDDCKDDGSVTTSDDDDNNDGDDDGAAVNCATNGRKLYRWLTGQWSVVKDWLRILFNYFKLLSSASLNEVNLKS